MNYISPNSPLALNRFGGRAPARRARAIPTGKLIEYANRLHRAGDLSRAETIFRTILAQRPDNPLALLSLGIIAKQTGSYLEALALMKRVLEIAPDYPQAANNLGNVYTDLGRFDDAVASYRRAIELNPDYADAYFNLGIVRQAQHKHEEARDALSECRRIVPRRADVHYEIGQCEQKLGNRLEAQIAYRVALHIEPKHAQARNSLARILAAMGRYDEAIQEFERALIDAPSDPSIMNGLGEAWKRVGKFDEALGILRKAYALGPENPETLLNIGAVNQCVGDIDVASVYFEQMLAVAPGVDAAEKCILFAALNRTDLSTDSLFDLHRRIRSGHDRPGLRAKKFGDRSRDPNRKLKVGFVSSDFRTHVIALNMLPLVGNYDRSQFEFHLYAQEKATDHVTQVFKEITDGYTPIERFDDAEAARIVEQDGIDILVLLAGRFDENRPLIASHRAAPIQVSFHDCATSGLEAMDYWLTDSLLHPIDTPEKFTERLYRLPVYYQYPVQDGLPKVSDLPALENGFVTFGCFNKPEKINEQVIALWSEVLRAVPNSKLLLKYFNYYSDSSMRTRWLNRFAAHGIGEDRLILKAKSDNRPNHLMLYHDVDIALDPFPFNGATTTFESLSMGVPVVALRGRHFVDRVAASMVEHTGHPELAAASKDAYVDIARRLAGDLGQLAKMRRTIREELHVSPLCDGATYTRNVQDAFRDMWRTWCATGGYRGK